MPLPVLANVLLQLVDCGRGSLRILAGHALAEDARAVRGAPPKEIRYLGRLVFLRTHEDIGIKAGLLEKLRETTGVPEGIDIVTRANATSLAEA